MLKTDMNERERARFAGSLRDVIKSAEECLSALELEDDSGFLVAFMIFSMQGSALSGELKPILLKAAEQAKRNSPGFVADPPLS